MLSITLKIKTAVSSVRMVPIYPVKGTKFGKN